MLDTLPGNGDWHLGVGQHAGIIYTEEEQFGVYSVIRRGCCSRDIMPYLASSPHIIRELLSALDHEHRARLRADVAADRLWQEVADMQASYAPSSRWRTREQIVGLVEEGE